VCLWVCVCMCICELVCDTFTLSFEEKNHEETHSLSAYSKNTLQKSTYLCFVSDFKINIIIFLFESNCTKGSENVCMYVNMYICIYSRVQIGWPSFLRTFNLVPRRTRILIGFIISTTSLPGTNHKSHGQNFGWLNLFRNNSRFLGTLSAIGCTYQQ